jgi:hypothetical protein
MGWSVEIETAIQPTRNVVEPAKQEEPTENELKREIENLKKLIISNSGTQPKPIRAGDTIEFGKYDWRVLDVHQGKALLISKDVTHFEMPYNKDNTSATWATCTLRKWLNDEFYRTSFSSQEQSRICLTTNVNENNQWFRTKGGKQTSDRIFLLSISEVVKYFGDSGQLKNKNPKSEYYIDDQYNQDRIANYNGKPAWWWLRSPSHRADLAARVRTDGCLGLSAFLVYFSSGGGGVRPALWLNL